MAGPPPRVVGALALAWGPLIAPLLRDSSTVCRHGLVLRAGRSRLWVPWWSLDPGRVVLIEGAGCLAWGRWHRDGGQPVHGALLDRALVLSGADTTARGLTLAAEAVRDAQEGRPISPRWAPFTTYRLGGTGADRLLRAIVEAMVADGYPVAGMAARAEASVVRLPWSPPHPGAYDELVRPRGPYDPPLAH